MKYPIYLPVCSSTLPPLPTQWTLYYHIVSKNKNDKCFVTKYTCANIIPYACKLILSINIKFLNMQPTTFSRLYNKMLPKLENNCRFRAGGIWLPIHSVSCPVCVLYVYATSGGYFWTPRYTYAYETTWPNNFIWNQKKEVQRAIFSSEKQKPNGTKTQLIFTKK